MKRYALLFALLLAFCGTGIARAQNPTQVNFTWNAYSTTTPACSATVTKSCLNGFTITDTTTSQAVVSNLALSSASYSWTPAAGTLNFGWDDSFTLTLTGVDGNGNAASSTPLSISITDSIINPPTGFAGTL